MALKRVDNDYSGQFEKREDNFSGILHPEDSSTSVKMLGYLSNWTDKDIKKLYPILTYRGELETADELPENGNKSGDIFFITSENISYVWVFNNTTGGYSWAQFSLLTPKDFIVNPDEKEDGQVLTYNGETEEWEAKDIKATPNFYSQPERISDYLYSIDYNSYDYEKGYEYYESTRPDPSAFACSMIKKGDFIGRNFDYTYTDYASFLIRTKSVQGRYATMGMAYGNNGLTKSVVDSGEYNDCYEVLPFLTLDAINECGVFVSANIVPFGDKGHTTGTNPGKQDICQLMLMRYIADYAPSAREAISIIINDLNIYAPIKQKAEECHFLICDANDSYIVEFVDNEIIIFSNTDDRYDTIPGNKEIVTNFYLTGWSGVTKAVYRGDTEEETRATGLTPHADGLERYDVLANAYESISSKQDIEDIMASIKYTCAYKRDTDPFWYSEYVGEFPEPIGECTIFDDADHFSAVVEYGIHEYETRTRDGKTWQTVHTSVYDLSNKSLSIYSQEDYENLYDFDFQEIPGKSYRVYIKDNTIIVGDDMLTVPLVDQEYDSTSQNAQSGVAVGEAIEELSPYLTWEKGSDVGAIQTATGNNTASSDYATALGYNAIASAEFSYSNGFETEATGVGAHAEGEATIARAQWSHTEGSNTVANYDPVTNANAMYAHVEGNANIANNLGEHAEGNFNVSNVGHPGQYPHADNTVHSVGIGTSTQRKNAFEIMQNGDAYMIGVGNYTGTTIDGADTIQEKFNDIDDSIEAINDDITDINSAITTINGEISTINGEIETIEEDITTINSNIETINDDISELKDKPAYYISSTQVVNWDNEVGTKEDFQELENSLGYLAFVDEVGYGNLDSSLKDKVDNPADSISFNTPYDATNNKVATMADIEDNSGVASFNGRSGVVVPASGDYTASMVGVSISGRTITAGDTSVTIPDSYTKTETDEKISTHNSSTQAHSDIRNSINTVDNKLDKTVLTTVNIATNTSTDTLDLTNASVNLKSGTTGSNSIPFPVASAVQAGVMNTSTYQSLVSTANQVQALTNGTVAIDNLSSTITQAELSQAWKTATGLTEVINGARIYDTSNTRLWVYYLNKTMWYEVAAGGSVEVSQFTNTSLGTIKGSTGVGQIYAETDGTGSVNGWDDLTIRITNVEGNIETLDSAIDSLSSDLSSEISTRTSEVANLTSALESEEEARIAKDNELEGKFDDYAEKATTLSGYGIEDAYISNGKVVLGVNEITPLTSDSNLNPAKVTQSSDYRFTTDSEKSEWDAKYDKPSTGIPKTDLSESVQESLGLADSALQEAPVTSVNGQTGDVTITIPDVSGKEDKSNKISLWSSTIAEDEYPSAQLVKDSLDEKADAEHTHDDRYYTETEVDSKLSGKIDNPSTKTSGQVLQYNGTTWVAGDVDALPEQSGHSGKFLTTNGSSAAWQSITTSDIVSGSLPDERIASAATWNAKQDELTFDDAPTAGSSNPVTSGGIASAIPTKVSELTNDSDFQNYEEVSLIAAAAAASKADINSPAFTGTPTAPTASSGTSTTQIATTAFVTSAINDLPEPMVFKGTLGVGGTITELPAASASNEGWTYKVITAGTYQSIEAKVGDTFISNDTTWVLIPSGDEPSGTVTNVGTGTGLTGGPITSTGTISLDTDYVATDSNNGLLSSEDKVKLDGIEEGATANIGTITGINMNGASKGTSGVVDLGTVITEHQDISGKENISDKVDAWSTTTTDDHYPSEKLVKDSLDGKADENHTHTKSEITDFPTLATVATSGSYNDLNDKPTIVNTTYTFANGTNGFTVTPSGGSAQTVTVTPSIANNITGSGTNGYLAKFSGANTIANAVALGSDTAKFLNNAGSFTNVVIPVLTADPASPAVGQIWIVP